MSTLPIVFSLAEKLVIVKMLDSVILVDNCVHEAELSALQVLMKRIGFDSDFILQARNIADEQGLSELRKMPVAKKKALAEILNDMAKADGFFHKKEMELIQEIRASIGLGDEINLSDNQ